MAACYLFFHCRFVSWVLFDRKLLWRNSETILLLEKTRKTSTPENTALVSIGLRIFYTDVYQSVTRQVNIFFVYISRIRMILSVLLAIGAIVYIVIYIAMETPENLVSLGGLAVFILLFYLFSHNPSKVTLILLLFK